MSRARTLSLNRSLDRYLSFGLGLIVFGVPFTLYSFYLLLSIPLTALGIACIVLGATVLLVPSSPVPANTVRAMVEGASINIEALLEEFDAKDKAVYLPPRDGRSWAFVPLSDNPGASAAWAAMDAPVRVMTDVEGEPGLMVFPPGSEIVRLSLLSEESGIEEALNYVLVDFLEAVDSVKAVTAEDRIIVQMENPRIRTDFPRFEMVLGSIPTSLAGCVVATVLGKPMLFIEETVLGKQIRATFRIAPKNGQE